VLDLVEFGDIVRELDEVWWGVPAGHDQLDPTFAFLHEIVELRFLKYTEYKGIQNLVTNEEVWFLFHRREGDIERPGGMGIVHRLRTMRHNKGVFPGTPISDFRNGLQDFHFTGTSGLHKLHKDHIQPCTGRPHSQSHGSRRFPRPGAIKDVDEPETLVAH
jgi:hypothetical protein